MEEGRHGTVRSVAIGARHVEDPFLRLVLRVGFALDGGEGAEEEIGGVGHDGARRGVILLRAWSL
jgi:hypothetical protein